MEIYLVMVGDRHREDKVYPFKDKDKAIREARRIAKKYCRHPEAYREYECQQTGWAEWLFYVLYSPEDESVRVLSATMDKEID